MHPSRPLPQGDLLYGDSSADRLDKPAGVHFQLDWRYALPIAAVHLLACLAFFPYFFSWTGLVLCLTGVYFYGLFGINICYHRLLTHRSFRCPAWLEKILVVIAVCCLEDAPASWVAAHRLHHKDADDQPDPHTPLAGFLWSHVGWLLTKNDDVRNVNVYDRYARDVLRTPFYLWLQRGSNGLIVYLLHALLYLLAGAAGGWLLSRDLGTAIQSGLSVLVWGVLLRTVIVWHVSWSVNSLSHLFGYRPFETAENSRNNWLVAALSSGEGWHNNHHADPASASNWIRWWEVDLVYLLILGMEKLGLASDVIRPSHQRRLRDAGTRV
ncbi:acyl-CoA desaturase [Lignipirellula cremea]|uniref:Fatty acid desaturase n=1 Tax=Lignipirellula cremea TaxID=2528010 RepID=A0A518DYQ3_9BACT|nr:fatty acid desaturase [Lignipirellula cremea]QDU96931.1 Fatty acid desaturase [Lignipirellula cremea]